MNELRNRTEFWIVFELFFDEVLNGFDIMIGGAFDRFDALTIVFREIGDDGIDFSNRLFRQGCDFVNLWMARQ